MQELPDLSDLNRFANRVWGIPEALIRRLPQGATEFIDLGEYFEAFTRLSSNIIRHEKILVREEYRTALQALQKDEYQGGVYLTGQPGIGEFEDDVGRNSKLNATREDVLPRVRARPISRQKTAGCVAPSG